MINEYFRIKDKCREGLLKYLVQAFSFLPEIENPKILDIGCGTGVPTLWIAEHHNGIITAVDIDKNSIDWLQEKISVKNLKSRLTTLNISFSELQFDPDYFDIILAEGFLNVVGFKKGFLKLIEMLRVHGYLIIHDEYKNHKKKCDFISHNHCELVDTLFLDENVWWNDYYRLLETAVYATEDKQFRDLFISDLKEIEFYKLDSKPFKSIYYIVRKQISNY